MVRTEGLQYRSLLIVVAFLACGVCATRPTSSQTSSTRVQELRAKVEEARAAVRVAQEELAQALEGQGSLAELSGNSVSTCKARIRSSSQKDAAEYLDAQHKLRAPYYIKSAWRSYEAGLRQKRGKDKSNDDPYIKQHEGQLQVAGALELDPDNAENWLEAGKVVAALLTLTEGAGGGMGALGFLAKACRMDPSMLQRLTEWLQSPGRKMHKDERKMHKQLWEGAVKNWNATGKVPEIDVLVIPTLTHGTCKLHSKVLKDTIPSTGSEVVDNAIKGFQLRSIFPTRIMTVNVKQYMPEGFLDRLSALLERKYASFAKEFPDKNPNDLNDKFFGYQLTSDRDLDSPMAKQMWPELYRDSKDFKLLRKLVGAALRSFVPLTGLTAEPSDGDADVIMWAAVYPGNGGRHGYHVHQSSISSCVFYVKTAGATTPISFIDPRGAPPVNDYEQHDGERDFEPVAPFHHNEYVFPDPGDLVCFPSWLVHNVPSHWMADARVAFAANLETNFWDAWHRTSTGW